MNGANTGTVRVYEYSGSSWVQHGNDIDGTEVGGAFGKAIAMTSDGRRIVVGSYAHDGGLVNSGLVTVFTLDSSSSRSPTWTRVGNAHNGGSTRAANAYYGMSVAISEDGTRISAGSLHTNNYRGHVRALSEPGAPSNVWAVVGAVVSGTGTGGGGSGVRCGYETHMSSDGSIMTSSCSYGANKHGQVRVYSYTGGVWAQLGDFIDGEVQTFDRIEPHEPQ